MENEENTCSGRENISPTLGIRVLRNGGGHRSDKSRWIQEYTGYTGKLFWTGKVAEQRRKTQTHTEGRQENIDEHRRTTEKIGNAERHRPIQTSSDQPRQRGANWPQPRPTGTNAEQRRTTQTNTEWRRENIDEHRKTPGNQRKSQNTTDQPRPAHTNPDQPRPTQANRDRPWPTQTNPD